MPTAAMAKGTRVVSERLSASDQLSELFWLLLVIRNWSSGEDGQLAQCYCDGCRIPFCCCIGLC